jgi:hypothetical protein
MLEYSSTKICAYVYLCTHKVSKHFYIGYRERNIALGRVSTVDFPRYKTSVKSIKENFNEYDWMVVAEFTEGNDAYDCEQQLIHENWDNPLMLNKSCFYQKTRFKGGHPISNDTKAKISKALKGKPSWHKGRVKTPETIERMHFGNKSRKPVTELTKQNMSKARAGKKVSPEIVAKQRASNTGQKRSVEVRQRMALAQQLRRAQKR